MTWNALTRPDIIARRATIGEIEAVTEVLARSLDSALHRKSSHREHALIRKTDATIALLRRKIRNLSEARSLWIEHFRKTETNTGDRE